MTKRKNNSILLIYNPHAGRKRKLITPTGLISLEEIKALLKQYQLPCDYAPTERAGHAKLLAEKAIKDGYDTVLVAGGDGTVGEAANGLVGSEIKMGIIPMGSFMNIAKMLSIPGDVEKAIEIIKIGRTRKIDVGSITKLEDEKLSKPYYFLETAGIGIEAIMHKELRKLEEGNLKSFFRLIKIWLNFYANRIKIITDSNETEVRASLVSIANGPFSGANLEIAPKAKLNDHMLSVTIYKMSKLELLQYFINSKYTGKTDLRRLTTIQTKKIKLSGRRPLVVHADATLFGKTPVECKVIPNALKVIYGFPANKDESSLIARTYLDP
jgi:diacylglycerol kinase (ATP)